MVSVVWVPPFTKYFEANPLGETCKIFPHMSFNTYQPVYVRHTKDEIPIVVILKRKVF